MTNSVAAYTLQAVDRATMAGFAPDERVPGRQVQLSETGRVGLFVWTAGDQQAGVSADPDQAIFVPPADSATGVDGAWRRIVGDGVALATWAGVETGGTVAQQAAINRLSDLSEVTTVVLPSGTVMTDGPIYLRSGKAIVGQGVGLTTVMALPGTTSGDGVNSNSNALLYAMPGAVGARAADMTLDGAKVGDHYLNGVNVFTNKMFSIERLLVKDTSGYAVWAVGQNGGGPNAYPLDHCSGVFRDIWVYNANVHFETSYANNVLFERCHARDGDGDIVCENWFHPYLSKNVTFRDCTGYGNASAGSIIANYLTDNDTENIVFENVSIEVVGETAGMAIIAFNGAIRNVRIVNSSIKSAGYIGAYTSIQGGTGVQAIFENTTVDGLQEGLTIGGQCDVTVRGGYCRARPKNANASNFPISFGVGATVILDGPTLDGAGAALATFPAAPGVTVLSQPRIIDKIPYSPMGRGHKISRVLTVDQSIVGTIGEIVGSKPPANVSAVAAFNFNRLARGTYRVQLAGTYRTDTANTGPLIAVQGYGTRRASGFIDASRTSNDANPTRGSFGVQGGSVFVVPDGTGSSRQFRSEFTLVIPSDDSSGFSIAAGPYNAATGVGAANGSLVIEAGAALTIEQL